MGDVIKVGPIKVHTGVAEKPELDNCGDLQLMAWKSEDIYVVAIRGTYSDPQWAINFQAKAQQVTFQGQAGDQRKIHKGMYDAVADNLLKLTKIFDQYNGEKRVIFTGHSLGYGVAQILALKLFDF